MLRIGAAVVLAVHGLIHLIGFVVPWQLAAIEGFPYRTALLNETLEVGDSGARFVGLIWLVLAVGFGIAASGLWRGRHWALLATVLLAAGSLVVCVLGLPEAGLGVLINVLILASVTYVTMTTPKRVRRVARP